MSSPVRAGSGVDRSYSCMSCFSVISLLMVATSSDRYNNKKQKGGRFKG